MRCTQYIGLTKRAQDYVENFEEVSSSEGIHYVAVGMFDEDVSLRAWRGWCHQTGHAYIIREMLQVSPWASGPMLFTCLELESRNGTKHKGIFQWVHDPAARDYEFDRKLGILWV